MKVYLLTPEGAAEKLEDLYALSDMLLASQAVAIAVDFRSWIKNNFELTSAQESYVDGMNVNAARYFGAQCSACFLNRIDIELVYPEPPTTPGYAKWTGSQSKVRMATDGNGNMSLTGSLVFTISYEV
ncbi:MAG: hypothetical protein J0G96_06335 [Flavobacteriia bacterium]|nr:hypothetical protein [Flavobacteriia bacterium]OJX36599.1 MAG: hypothetical protein BGO87_12415 [Flavobacteriia bacterium 40-80]